MPLRAQVQCIVIFLALNGRFLFRREKEMERERVEAMDDLFEFVRLIMANAATLKQGWQEDWEKRGDVNLPPKFDQSNYLYPRAVDAAVDAKYTRALLYQNRWKSKISPLFETYDPEVWTNVRAMIERSSPALMNIREAHRGIFHAEEASWIERAVEGLDRARYILRNAEKREMEPHEVVSTATYQTLYTVLQLSETMLEGLRLQAEER